MIYKEPNKIYLAVLDRKFQTLEKRYVNPIITIINGLINVTATRRNVFEPGKGYTSFHPSFSISVLTRFHTH